MNYFTVMSITVVIPKKLIAFRHWRKVTFTYDIDFWQKYKTVLQNENKLTTNYQNVTFFYGKYRNTAEH